MNEAQRRFLEGIADRIPRLFEAIGAGNVRAEFIIGLRRVGPRHVRLKLVAEVVDPGANPLGTHGPMPSLTIEALVAHDGPLPGDITDVAIQSVSATTRERKARARAIRNDDPELPLPAATGPVPGATRKRRQPRPR